MGRSTELTEDAPLQPETPEERGRRLTDLARIAFPDIVGDDGVEPGNGPGYYVVTAYRWGDTERHSYVVSVCLSLAGAKAIARDEEESRGGKYACGIAYDDGSGNVPRMVREPELRPEIKHPGAARRDELSEALLWAWAAEHNAHDWNDCGEDNDATGPGDIPCRTCAEIADMRDTAAAEVGRLLREAFP